MNQVVFQRNEYMYAYVFFELLKHVYRHIDLHTTDLFILLYLFISAYSTNLLTLGSRTFI